MFRDNKAPRHENRAHGGPRPRRNRSADSLRKGKEYVMNKASGRSREAAEALAIQALNFLATEPARLSRFLALSGLEAQSIRAAAAESGFLAGVLVHLGEDERLLLEFAAEAGVTPAEVDRARRLLAGGDFERDVP